MPLIVLEGIDGCGKSTQHELLVARLRQAGHQPLCLREPGGTALGERLRDLLLDPATEATPRAELLAYQVARAQLVESVLRPALARGSVVLLDRFWYSTIAYQAYGLGLDTVLVRAAIDLAIGDLAVDCALCFRLPVAVAAARRAQGRDGADRIERRGEAYLARVAAGYEALIDSGELTAIDASGSPEQVGEQVWREVAAVL